MTAREILKLRDRYEIHRNPKQAAKMIAYLKDRFGSFGIKHPDRRLIDKDFISQYGLPDESTIKELFAEEEREFHHFAMESFFRDKRQWIPDSIQMIEWMMTHKSWWDSLDHLAVHQAHYFFKRFPDNRLLITGKWNQSSNMWLQRASVIYQIKSKDSCDLEQFARHVLHLIHSDEFFIRKAIGWALREQGKTHPEWVLDFVEKTPLHSLSRREAIRNLV